jgi:hypothetical protein
VCSIATGQVIEVAKAARAAFATLGRAGALAKCISAAAPQIRKLRMTRNLRKLPSHRGELSQIRSKIDNILPL